MGTIWLQRRVYVLSKFESAKVKVTEQKSQRKEKKMKVKMTFNGDLKGFEGFTRNNGPTCATRDLYNGEGGESDTMDETDEAASNHIW